MRKREETRFSLGFDLEHYIIPAEGQMLDVYTDAIQRLRSNESIFNRSLGRISWLQGRILLRAREACRKLGKRGDWGKFLQLTGYQDHKPIAPGTARLLMKIADQVSEESSRKLKYIEMLSMVYPSFRKEMDAAESDVGGMVVVNQQPASPARGPSQRATVVPDRSQSPSRRSPRANAPGGADSPMTLSEYQQAVANILRLAQPLGNRKVVLPEDERAIENIRRMIEEIHRELLNPLTPAEKRVAA